MKLKKGLLVILAFLGLGNSVWGQDSLRVMVYNLLNYGNYTTFCTTNNNNIGDKDGYLKTITDYVRPDVLGVNEMASNTIYGSRILANVLNTDSVTYYKKATYSNQAVSSIVNMLFYDSRKLQMYEEIVVPSTIRDINIYTLYYKDVALASGADTSFISFVLAHLKAGNGSGDQQTRDAMVQTAMSTIKSNNLKGNLVFMGDLNVYNANEPAYQRLVDESDLDYRFYDPINRQGSWNNSSGFADVHTQSTHTSGGCPSGGGMDDRFDQILVSSYILGDSSGVKYMDGSYWAVGQDGNRFNSSLLSPNNTSAPSGVIQALYDMSDHLPVILDLEVDGTYINGLANRSMDRVEGFELKGKDLIIKNGFYVKFKYVDLLGRKRAGGTLDNGRYSLTQILPPIEGMGLLIVEDPKSGSMVSHKILNR